MLEMQEVCQKFGFVHPRDGKEGTSDNLLFGQVYFCNQQCQQAAFLVHKYCCQTVDAQAYTRELMVCL